MTYRKNIAAFVLNKDSYILTCERSDVKGAWQLPQGGIEDNETLEEALYRELEEEIGVKKVEIIAQLPQPIRYDWPENLHKKGYLGQEQWYFLVRLDEKESIDLSSNKNHIEFQSYDWVGAEEFLSRLAGFKKEAYIQALREFQIMLPNLIKA